MHRHLPRHARIAEAEVLSYAKFCCLRYLRYYDLIRLLTSHRFDFPTNVVIPLLLRTHLLFIPRLGLGDDVRSPQFLQMLYQHSATNTPRKGNTTFPEITSVTYCLHPAHPGSTFPILRV